jgi:hypothetical protein
MLKRKNFHNSEVELLKQLPLKEHNCDCGRGKEREIHEYPRKPIHPLATATLASNNTHPIVRQQSPSIFSIIFFQTNK